jgi:ABC-type glycerol-3-phosphate transport system substrate-binding protein
MQLLRRNALCITVLALLLMQGYAWAAKPIVVRLWNSDTYRNEGLRPLVEEFNATHIDIRIELEEKSGEANSLIPAVVGGAGPNVIVGASTWDRDYYDQGILADLRGYVLRDRFSLAEYFPSTLEFGSLPSGELFSLPLDSQIIVMYYNPQVLGAAGLVQPSQGWSNADFLAMTGKLRRRESDGTITQHAVVGRHPNHVGMYFMGQNRSYVVDLSRGVESTVRTPGFRAAYALIGDLIGEDRLRIQGVHSGVDMSLFTNGKAGFYMDGNFRLLDLTEAMDGVSAAPLLVPSSGESPGAYLWTRTLALVKSGDDKADEAAWQVIKYLSSADALARYAVGARLLPVARSSIAHPKFREYVRSYGASIDMMANVYLPAGSGLTEMAAPRAGDIRGPWGSLQTRFMRGEIPLSTFIEELATQVERVVQEITARE